MKQSNFSRSLANDLKMGAYYTDPGHCKRIGYLVEFPPEEVSVLEPSIGDGKAIYQIVGERDNVSVFGVELNEETYETQISNNPNVPYSLNADFLSGVKISHGSFGYCFANPPYGEMENGIRMEQKFVEKLHPYLKSGAPFTLVIPYYVLTQERFLASFLARFEPKMVYRFDDDVYVRFKQVVIVGTKRRVIGYKREDMRTLYESIDDVEKLPYLPKTLEEVEKKVSAVPSSPDAIEYFTTVIFDRKKAAEQLNGSSLYVKAQEMFVKDYSVSNLSRPVIPLKPDMLYLLAVCGGGQGMVGSEKNGDMHLQRGVAKVVQTRNIEENEEGGRTVERVRSFTRVELNVIENDGTITTLS